MLSYLYIPQVGAGCAASEMKVFVETKTTELKGKVIDKSTGEGLAAVEIELMGTNKRVYTDFDGNFKIKEVDPGAHALLLNLISYQFKAENVYVKITPKNEIVIEMNSIHIN